MSHSDSPFRLRDTSLCCAVDEHAQGTVSSQDHGAHAAAPSNATAMDTVHSCLSPVRVAVSMTVIVSHAQRVSKDEVQTLNDVMLVPDV